MNMIEIISLLPISYKKLRKSLQSVKPSKVEKNILALEWQNIDSNIDSL